MLKAKIFDRQGRSFDELTLELNAFFEAVGDDIPASGIDVQEDHVLAIYEDRSDEVVAGRKEQLETLYEAKRKSVANWLTQETTRRHWEAMVLKKSGGDERDHWLFECGDDVHGEVLFSAVLTRLAVVVGPVGAIFRYVTTAVAARAHNLEADDVRPVGDATVEQHLQRYRHLVLEESAQLVYEPL